MVGWNTTNKYIFNFSLDDNLLSEGFIQTGQTVVEIKIRTDRRTEGQFNHYMPAFWEHKNVLSFHKPQNKTCTSLPEIEKIWKTKKCQQAQLLCFIVLNIYLWTVHKIEDCHAKLSEKSQHDDAFLATLSLQLSQQDLEEIPKYL